MERIKDIYKSFIMLFSEIIWIYYTIVIFASTEWNRPVFFDPTWFALAGAMGYMLNALSPRRSSHVFLFLGNIAVLGFMIVQNWRSIVPEGSWGLGLAVSIGLSIIFARSARLVYRRPTRQEILRRFEGNVIYYIVFAFMSDVNNWGHETFHLFFIFAAASSLMGILLTLQSHEMPEDDQKTKIIKVGQSGWFAGVMIALTVCIPLFSLALFLPSVNRALYSLGMGFWGSLKWIARSIGDFLLWLFSFLPDPEMEAIPGIPPGQSTLPSEAAEKPFGSLIYLSIVVGTAVLAIIIAIWISTKLTIKRRLPKLIKPKQITINKETWRQRLKKNLKSWLQYLKLKWRMRFQYFYHQPVYWYYHQVLRWGKNNGIPRIKSETSREYVQKIIEHIPEGKNCFSYHEQDFRLAELLKRLNRDYQEAYYGERAEKTAETEYKILIIGLKGIRLTTEYYINRVMPKP